MFFKLKHHLTTFVRTSSLTPFEILAIRLRPTLQPFPINPAKIICACGFIFLCLMLKCLNELVNEVARLMSVRIFKIGMKPDCESKVEIYSESSLSILGVDILTLYCLSIV